ncbi:hypothetical protein ABFX02_06G143200 [Erythranthe guttata]
MIPFRRLNKNSIAPIYNAFFSTQIPPSSAHYDDLINAAGKQGDFASVRHLLSKRLSQGCLNTTKTFKFIATDVSVLDDLLLNLAAIDDWFAKKHAHDSLVAQLANLHRTAEALRVAEIMGRKNYGATAATFNPILNALAKKKDMLAAWRVVEAMRACIVKPSITSFNYILTAYCFTGDVASAADTLVKMEEEGVKADAITYDALVLGACRAGKVEGAVAVMRRMVDDGVVALFSTHGHIIKEMVGCGYYAAAVDYVRMYAGGDEKLDAENFGYLARRFKNVKRIAEAESVVVEMEKRGLQIDDGLKDLSPSFLLRDTEN